MIIMSLKEAVEATPALKALLAVDLPFVAAHRLSRVMDALVKPVQAFEELRFKAFRERGHEVEGQPGSYSISDLDVLKQVAAELEAVLTEEVKIDLEPLTAAQFGDATVKGEWLVALKKIIA